MAKNKMANVALRKVVYEKFAGHCAYCGSELGDRFQVDHYIPKRRYKNFAYSFDRDKERGTDNIENLMPCCCSCNSSKSDLDLEEFRERVLDRVFRLNKYSGEYSIAKRFGLIKEMPLQVIFHFEKFEVGNG